MTAFISHNNAKIKKMFYYLHDTIIILGKYFFCWDRILYQITRTGQLGTKQEFTVDNL